MRETRLVFVEGLPGSGKSTTAQYVARRLRHAQAAARLVAEVEPEAWTAHAIEVMTNCP